jgi:transketolase
MRGVFLDKLFQKMETDETIFFLTADMGINLVERFEENFPDRFLNVGIAEQNLIGIAAGLAESGMRPYVYTISNFLVHRCFEQIRNDIVIHKLPIVLVLQLDMTTVRSDQLITCLKTGAQWLISLV